MSFPVSWSDPLLPLFPPSKLSHSYSSNNENLAPLSLKKLQSLSNPKTSIPLPKPTKNTAHSIRAGDWICLLCNNLNFSFRNECNRCQKQTKKQNYIQNLILLSDEPNSLVQKNPNTRKPLQDLTNVYHQRDSSIEIEKIDEKKQQNKGFENMLLLTPPKPFTGEMKLRKLMTNNNNGSNNNNNTFLMNSLPFNSPSSETNKKITKPYNSPQQIPSISPILKPDFLRGSYNNNNKVEEPCARNLSEFLCDKIYEDSREDELGCSNEENREEPIERIFSKLMDEESSSSNQSQSFGNKMNSFGSNKENEGNQNNLLNTLMGFMSNASYLGLGTIGNNNKDLKQKKKNKNKAGNPENERKSDWYCPNCNNLNYSFRFVCNRCQALKPETN